MFIAYGCMLFTFLHSIRLDLFCVLNLVGILAQYRSIKFETPKKPSKLFIN